MATSRNRDYSAPPEGIKNVAALYAWNENAIVTGAQNPQTGAWKSAIMDDNGNLKVAINGNINITGVTVNQSVLEGYAETGNMLSVSGNAFLAAISGHTSRIVNPIGVTGTRTDLASGYSANNYLMVGGRAVEVASGFNPQYGSGANSMLNIDRANGAVLVEQTDLYYQFDSVTSYPPQGSTVSNSTVSGSIGAGVMQTGLALPSNTGRKNWFVQNTSNTAALYVKLGQPPVSTGSFNLILNPSSTLGHGGGSFADDSYTGPVSISGASFIIWEI